MIRRAPATQNVPVHYTRHTCPEGRSALTTQAWVTINPDGTVQAVQAQIGIGPGVGPHITPSWQTVARWGWQLLTLAGAMRRAAHQPAPVRTPHPPGDLELAGQLTFEDA